MAQSVVLSFKAVGREARGAGTLCAPDTLRRADARPAAAALLAGLVMLVTMLLTGCGQSAPAAQGSPAQSLSSAGEPVKAAPPATAAPAAGEPVKAAPPAAAPAPTAAAPAAPEAAPPAIAPERLAAARELLSTKGCIGCHTLAAFPEAVGVIGPDLTHINTEAATVIETQLYKDSKGEATTTRDFLRESILTPSAYICQECATGPCPDFVMPRDFKSRLTSDEIETILDLLVTLD